MNLLIFRESQSHSFSLLGKTSDAGEVEGKMVNKKERKKKKVEEAESATNNRKIL